MFKTPLFSRYRIGEFIQFIRNTLIIVDKYDPAKLKLKVMVDALAKHHQNLQEAYKQESFSNITPQLAALDDKRDQAIICIQRISKGYSCHYDAQKVAASKQIKSCMAKYGNKLYTLNYGTETAILKNLIRDLQSNPACVAALEELHLTDVVEVMQQANEEFEALFVQRLEQFSQHEPKSSKELIELTTEAYRTLVQYVEAHARLTPTESYTSLVRHINENIDHYNKVVTKRKSGAADDAAPVATDIETPANEQASAYAV